MMAERRWLIWLPPGVEESWAYKAYMKGVSHMAPQDDLTAERADLKEIARKLVLQINEITPVQWDKHDDKDQAIILAALKAARQEALIDVMRLHKEWRAGKHSGLFSDLLDRLASEGG